MRRNTAGAAEGTGLRALRRLARGELSAAALRETLLRAGLSPAAVEAELEAAARLGALDDRRASRARARVLVLRGGWARAAMHARLVQEGYPATFAEEALTAVIQEEGWDERSTAARTLVPGEPPRRSARRLLARGFAPALVRALLPGVEGMEEPG